MGTYSTVSCSEVEGTAEESYTREGPTAKVTLDVAWNSRHSLLDDLLLNQREWPLGAYVQKPTVASVAIVGYGDPIKNGQSISYSRAKAMVTYDTVSTSLVSEELEPTLDFRVEDYREFQWTAGDDTGVPILEGQAPGRQLFGMKLKRTLYNIATLPPQLLTLVGKCNDSDYTSSFLGLTFPEETLAYIPPTMRRTISSGGAKGWTIALQFKFKEEGWNKYWRAGSAAYEYMYRVGETSPHKNLPPADMSAVLF